MYSVKYGTIVYGRWDVDAQTLSALYMGTLDRIDMSYPRSQHKQLSSVSFCKLSDTGLSYK